MTKENGSNMRDLKRGVPLVVRGVEYTLVLNTSVMAALEEHFQHTAEGRLLG